MKIIAPILTLFLSISLHAQEYSANIKPVNGKFKEADYFIWVPENVKTIKGIILHQHGCGETAYRSGRNAFYDPQWRALSKKWDFALMGSSYVSTTDCFDWINPEEGSYNSLEQGISAIARSSNHQELENVPFVLWGHSGGGHWAYKMVLQHPDKIICAVLKSPAWCDTSSLALEVPLLCIMGVHESYNEFSSFVWAPAIEAMKYRIRKNAPICIAPDPLSGHESANSRLIAIVFIDEILKLRSSENTLLINRNDQCYFDFDAFKLAGRRSEIPGINNVNWLPDKYFSEKWLEFINSGNIVDNTPPVNPPFNVLVKNNGHGNIVRWEANADLESGIREFRIYRNDKLIDEDFIKSRWNFKIDYHDNLIEIPGKYEYVDRNINTRKKYKYQISFINQAGLESPRSEAKFAEKE